MIKIELDKLNFYIKQEFNQHGLVCSLEIIVKRINQKLIGVDFLDALGSDFLLQYKTIRCRAIIATLEFRKKSFTNVVFISTGKPYFYD